jgi:hypothetical protein
LKLEWSRMEQKDVAAAAALTQLTRLFLQGDPIINVSCLSALTGLQSLALQGMQLAAPGLSLVAQGCSSLTQLQLRIISMQPPLPGQLPPSQAHCSWPAMLELEVWGVLPGVVSHVLPTSKAAPRLAHLAKSRFAHWPEKNGACFKLRVANAEQQQLEDVGQLAADLRCLAACSAPCQALDIYCLRPDRLHPHNQGQGLTAEAAVQLAAAVAPLAPTLTHLFLNFDGMQQSQASMLIAQALPQLRSLYLDQPQMSYVT